MRYNEKDLRANQSVATIMQLVIPYFFWLVSIWFISRIMSWLDSTAERKIVRENEGVKKRL